MLEDTLPSSRGRTLNVSMALATLGLVIWRSASICWVVSVTVVSLVSEPVSDGALAPLHERTLELGDDLRDTAQVRVDAEGLPEVVEGALRLIELEVDLAVAGQGPEVARVALHHLVAVLERLLVLAHQEIDGGPLVPAFREVGPPLDDRGERGDGGRSLAAAHLLDADLEQVVGLRVAGAAPHLPDRVLGERADDLVAIG